MVVQIISSITPHVVFLVLILFKAANQTLVLFVIESKPVCCNPPNSLSHWPERSQKITAIKMQRRTAQAKIRPAGGWVFKLRNRPSVHGEPVYCTAPLTPRLPANEPPCGRLVGDALSQGGMPPPLAAWGRPVPSGLAKGAPPTVRPVLTREGTVDVTQAPSSCVGCGGGPCWRSWPACRHTGFPVAEASPHPRGSPRPHAGGMPGTPAGGEIIDCFLLICVLVLV